jgi:hypothetical protein
VGLSDLSGVFSKYFVVGFFAPAFFTLTALKLALSHQMLPDALQPDKTGIFLVLGGIALLAGLLLVGLEYPITRLFEGYPLRLPYRGAVSRILAALGDALTVRQGRRWDYFHDLVKDDKTAASAAWRMQRAFPEQRTSVMPTRLGNAINAFEQYPKRRWGLNAIVTWPHISALLSESERQLDEDRRGDLAFFQNSCIGALVATPILAADAFAYQPHPHWLDWIYVLPLVLGRMFYLGAVGAAERWGVQVRASFDLHRLDLYDKLGLVRPKTLKEERELGAALTAWLLWGVPLPDELRAPEADDQSESESKPAGASAAGSP